MKIRLRVFHFSFPAVSHPWDGNRPGRFVLFLFTSFTLREFEKANKANIEHEGLLLSHMMESAIHDLALNKNIEGMQSFIDRLVGQRDKNDIEINVLFSKGKVRTSWRVTTRAI